MNRPRARRTGAGAPRTVSVSGVAALTAVLLAAAVGLTSATSQADPQRNRLDLTSIAIPTGAQPQVRDTAFDVERLQGRQPGARTSAAATSDCDGCSAVATTLGVVYAEGSRASGFDNVATAWDSCADCSATTVSVQVVVLRHAAQVTANNRALAVNAACTGCHASAAAYQLVVVEPRGRQLSRSDIEQLRQWVDEQADALAGSTAHVTTSSAGRSSAAPSRGTSDVALDELEHRLDVALGGTITLDRSAAVRRG